MHLFYDPHINQDGGTLSPVESQHCVKTLRHQVGEKIMIANGKGLHYETTIIKANPKACTYGNVKEFSKKNTPMPEVHLAIAPTKNMDRIEWMVEKCSELGINHIHFLYCRNSERKVLKLDRLEKKTVAALKQSKNHFITQVYPIEKLSQYLDNADKAAVKFIAYVNPKLPHLATQLPNTSERIEVLIGPEGDFSQEELKNAQDAGFQPVSLGNAVLRTETAGLIAGHTILLHSIIS